jgi:hypothetical protein
MRAFGRATILVFFAAACSRDDHAAQSPPAVDPSQLSNSSGEVTLADGNQLSYDITSERYKQWYTAQQSLDHATAARFGAILHPNSPTQSSIAQASTFLLSNPATKQAIEHTGMSVRDFVTTTVALQQQLREAAHAGGNAMPSTPYMVPPPIDTSLPVQPPVGYAPMPPTPPVPAPALDTPASSLTRPDSVVDSARMRPRHETMSVIRTDTIQPKRDTTTHSVTPPPSSSPRPADSSAAHRDTTSAAPRDSLRSN